MWQSIFHPVITYLHMHPHAAGVITFFLVFAEAMAVIGTIFPGTVTMTAIGVLIGSGIIPGTSTIVWAVFGAICGDTLSYIIGYKYKGQLHRVWPFTRWPKLLGSGEKFFKSHGGKSIIIGRFFGPMRSMVPMVAGMFRMRPGRFLLAAIPSASAWAIIYLTPGILLGAISLELPPELTFEFIAITLSVLTVLVLIIWIIQLSIRSFTKKVDRETRKIWNLLRTHKTSHWITRLLTNPHHPENHRQLILLTYAIVTGLLFLVVAISAFSHGIFTWLNSPLYHLLRNLRTHIIDNIMLTITILGSVKVMLTGGGIILGWLCLRRKWRTAAHWLAALFLSSAAVGFLKSILFSPRPNHLLHGPINSSFPSGHTTLAVTIFGFLAVLIGQELDKELKKFPYIIATLLVFLIALSRLFLGAHWLTDIAASILLGATLILLVTISYRRAIFPHIGPKRTIIACSTIFAIVWIVFGWFFFAKYKHDYTLFWPTKTITLQQLKQHSSFHFPLYRRNRLGEPREAFNVELLGNLTKIKQNLVKQDWVSHAPCLSLKGLIYRLSTTNTTNRLPLLPQLYHNECPVLLLTKKGAKKGHSVILRLWSSRIKIKDRIEPFWLGTVSYHQHTYKLLTFKSNKDARYFFGATNELTPYLGSYKWHAFYYPPKKQPKVMGKLHWDGAILLILAKG